MSIHLVLNGEEARKVINTLNQQGYTADQIYVLAHEKDRTEAIAEKTSASEIGYMEEGLFGTIANLFRSRGDALLSKMRSLGMTDEEAEYYESRLDKGYILVASWPLDPDRTLVEGPQPVYGYTEFGQDPAKHR